MFGLWNSNYLVFQMDFTLVSSKIVEIFKMIFKYKEIAKESRLKVLKEMERSLKRYISQATMMTKWNQNSLPCKITLIAIQLKTVTHAWVIFSRTFGKVLPWDYPTFQYCLHFHSSRLDKNRALHLSLWNSSYSMFQTLNLFVAKLKFQL